MTLAGVTLEVATLVVVTLAVVTLVVVTLAAVTLAAMTLAAVISSCEKTVIRFWVLVCTYFLHLFSAIHPFFGLLKLYSLFFDHVFRSSFTE